MSKIPELNKLLNGPPKFEAKSQNLSDLIISAMKRTAEDQIALATFLGVSAKDVQTAIEVAVVTIAIATIRARLIEPLDDGEVTIHEVFLHMEAMVVE